MATLDNLKSDLAHSGNAFEGRIRVQEGVYI